jgi:hypothetical protein
MRLTASTGIVTGTGLTHPKSFPNKKKHVWAKLEINENVVLLRPWRMRWAGHVVRMGENRNAYRIMVGKPEGKRQLGRPRRR